MENSVEIREVSKDQEGSRKELSAPYVIAIRQEAKEKITGHEGTIDIIFDEINRQAIENFSVNESRQFPGVKFSSLFLQVTPDLIKKINPNLNQNVDPEKPGDQESKPKRYVYFLQPAFGMYPRGNAYSVLDLGIDRFIREISRVTGAMKRGEKPPEIDIYLVGAPHSFAGQVTKEWIDAIKKDGFGPHGRIYAEFMEDHWLKEGTEPARTRVTMQAVSKGSSTSVETSKNLSENLRERTQRLYDIPVGNHERKIVIQALKSTNILAGMTLEMLARIIGARIGADPTSKSLFQTEPQFYKDMAKRFNLPQDDPEQSKMKASCLRPELVALMKGTPFDESKRTFVRQPEFDPVNLNVGNLLRVLTNTVSSREKLVASQKGLGKTLNFPTSRKLHFYAHKKSFTAWGRIMEFVENSPKPPEVLPQTAK